MVQIPEDKLTPNDLVVWASKKQQLAALQAEERLLRAKVFKHFFPVPKEGTNTANLDTLQEGPGFTGYVIKGDYPIERKVDEVLLEHIKNVKVGDVREQLASLKLDVASVADDVKAVEFLKLPLDKLIRYKPELATKEYRMLTSEQATFFNQILDIKPGSPQVKIEPTKETKAALDKAAEIAAAPAAPVLPAVVPAPPPVAVDVVQHSTLTPEGDMVLNVPVFTQLDPSKPPF